MPELTVAEKGFCIKLEGAQFGITPSALLAKSTERLDCESLEAVKVCFGGAFEPVIPHWQSFKEFFALTESL